MCLSRIICFFVHRLQLPAAKDGDDFGLYIFKGDTAVFPAVCSLCPVVPQNEHTSFRYGVWIFDAVFRIGGEQNLSALYRPVHKERSCVIHSDHIRLASHNPSHMGLTVRFINNHIIFDIFSLHTETDNQVAVFYGRKHAVAGRLHDQKYLGEKQDSNDSQSCDICGKPNVAAFNLCGVPPPADNMGAGRKLLCRSLTGRYFFCRFHCSTSFSRYISSKASYLARSAVRADSVLPACARDELHLLRQTSFSESVLSGTMRVICHAPHLPMAFPLSLSCWHPANPVLSLPENFAFFVFFPYVFLTCCLFRFSLFLLSVAVSKGACTFFSHDDGEESLPLLRLPPQGQA